MRLKHNQVTRSEDIGIIKKQYCIILEDKKFGEIYNIVENLSITAGVPMPNIYIINDPSPNAFATGRNPKNASIAVTTGLLDILDRSEIEGVIAHELSHIKNYDILTSCLMGTK